MDDVKQTIVQALAAVVERLPVGTNRALYQFLWMLVSGALHDSRGAIFPALKKAGLSDAETRRAWAAMSGGAWQISALLTAWRKYVTGAGHWRPFRYAGYVVKAVDITAYRRPALKGLDSKHYDAEAGKALPAVVFGLVAQVGRVGEQRLALLTDIVRGDQHTTSEKELRETLLQRVAQGLQADEMPVFDAGFHIKALFQAKLERFVVRLPVNFTARRNVLPEYKGGRPPEYGEIVRPLARTRKGKEIPATPPDRTETWKRHGLEFRAEFWDDLVLRENKVASDNRTFVVAAVHDPRFEKPWLLACPLKLSGPEFLDFYRARWPIEQLPLAAKHMVGAHRQFVSSEESSYRLPELSLLAGSILTYLAAILPPIPTGFWDRHPKRTPGRLRRWLGRMSFSDLPPPTPGRIRKKASVTAHLPKGVEAHRRSRASEAA